MSFHKTLLAGLLITALAACGHGSSSSSNTQSNGVMTNQTANPSPTNVANPPMGGKNAEGNAMAPGTFATIPPTVQCGAVQPVWVNTKSHVYHLPSDPLYGRTKHGEYMCPSAAKAHGYHAAGAKNMKSSGNENGGGM